MGHLRVALIEQRHLHGRRRDTSGKCKKKRPPVSMSSASVRRGGQNRSGSVRRVEPMHSLLHQRHLLLPSLSSFTRGAGPLSRPCLGVPRRAISSPGLNSVASEKLLLSCCLAKHVYRCRLKSWAPGCENFAGKARQRY